MSATSSPSTLGKCVVCGVETKKKCSTCNKSGLDWMCFCSVDHQKLIWKVHKRVCGQNPFEWPIFDEKEVKAAWERRNLQVFAATPATWLEVVSGQFEGSPIQIVEKDQSKMEAHWKKALEDYSDPSKISLVQSALVQARSLSLCTKDTSIQSANLDDKGTKLEISRLLSKNPLEFLSNAYRLYVDVSSDPVNSTIPSDCLHRLLIFYTVLAVQLELALEQGKKLDWKEDKYVQHVLHELALDTARNNCQELVGKLIGGALVIAGGGE
ncbi:hypothetical protein JCM3765_006478 [Sporobolomyces pararoseus]